MSYTYGMVSTNNGQKFRARRDDETGAVEHMDHSGLHKSSKKMSSEFKAGYDVAVPASNKYRFPDEYENQNMPHSASDKTGWRQH